MTFTKDFVSGVKKAFPRDADLHRALDRGDTQCVERFLSSRSSVAVTPRQLVCALKTGRHKKLLAQAEAAMRVGRLFTKFKRLTDKSPFNDKSWG